MLSVVLGQVIEESIKKEQSLPALLPALEICGLRKGKAREMERTQVLFIRFDAALQSLDREHHCYISVNSDKICDSGIVRKV